MKAGVQRVAERVPSLPAADVILLRLVHIVAGGLEQIEELWLKPHQLASSEFRTLMMLYSSPGQQSHPSDLCQWATQKPTNMTRIIDGLLQRGLVSRRPSEQDRRRIILKVTPTGAKLIRTLLPQLHPHVSTMFENFSASERRQFGRLLEKMLHNIDTMDTTGE
jgi:DNA-binding MarR family transcriptional regulator